MDIPVAEIIIERKQQRYYRDDLVRWVWIFYGLAQAVVTMLLAFNVIHGTTIAAVVTAVALIIYVGVNEILVRPYRSRTEPKQLTPVDQGGTTVPGSTLPPS